MGALEDEEKKEIHCEYNYFGVVADFCDK